jgi:hypothetical protein
MRKERAARLPGYLDRLPRLYDSAADYEEEEDCAEPTRDGELDRSVVDAVFRRADAVEAAVSSGSGIHTIDASAAKIADAIAEIAEPLDSEHAARGREPSVVLSQDELQEDQDQDEPPPISNVRDTLLDEVEVECLFDAPPPSSVPEADLERNLAVSIEQRLIGIPFPADPGELQPIVPVTRCRIPKVRVPTPPIAIAPLVPLVGRAPNRGPIAPETSSVPRLFLTLLALVFAAALATGYLYGWVTP